MKKKTYGAVSVIFALLVMLQAVCIVGCAAEPVADPQYTAELVAAGFPADYAEKLSLLHAKHPAWTFEPLDVTGLSGGKYTWDYVIYQEYNAEAARNLVSSSESYSGLRDYTDFKLYDSGWYKASKAAVEYMMDPRNFFDEKQIFQFYSLSWSDTVTPDAVSAAIRGTFMENAKLDGEYSDMTYAEYFMEVGRELGASPVYLAARIRNEQGVAGTSPLISGQCGDVLWGYYDGKVKTDSSGHQIGAPDSGYTEEGLKAYNGLYNYFNIGAAGTGYFQIFVGGMKEALNGTPAMAEKWGSPSWNTRWKAIYGGAKTATERYINDYQNTSYLQKFNVDPRSSRNFWGQYMQSIHGSYSQASTFYSSFVSGKMLDLAWNFVIPVYEGMPEACTYPTGGELPDTSVIKKLGGRADYVDLASLKGDGVKKSYAAEKIAWPVFVGSTGMYLDLGKIDLSVYSDVIIDYSVGAKFDFFACGQKSVIGLVWDSGHIYGGEGSEPDMSCDLGSYRMADGAEGGFLRRRTARIDLTAVAHNGSVYLTAYTQKDQKYIVHNIVFVAKEGYVPPTPEEYTHEAVTTGATDSAEVTSAAAEETEAKPGNGSPSVVIAVSAAAAVSVLCAAVSLFTVLGKRRNGEQKPEEKERKS
ncbi:MAG: hypothetical protein MJ137_08065 [Clostridia bacterium]|nr:hypothetical protein [Clostridia bacterium]